MNNLNIFCFGFGQVAKCFIRKLKLENFNINLSTTSREKTHTKKFLMKLIILALNLMELIMIIN